jgi:hypothetical protein
MGLCCTSNRVRALPIPLGKHNLVVAVMAASVVVVVVVAVAGWV